MTTPNASKKSEILNHSYFTVGNKKRLATLKNCHFLSLFVCVCVCVCMCVFRATPTAYGVSQARGRIGAVAAGLHHSHINARPEPHL